MVLNLASFILLPLAAHSDFLLVSILFETHLFLGRALCHPSRVTGRTENSHPGLAVVSVWKIIDGKFHLQNT